MWLKADEAEPSLVSGEPKIIHTQVTVAHYSIVCMKDFLSTTLPLITKNFFRLLHSITTSCMNITLFTVSTFSAILCGVVDKITVSPIMTYNFTIISETHLVHFLP